ADDPQDRAVGKELVLLALGLLGRALGVELLQLVGDRPPLLVPLVDGHLDAVADVDPEVGAVTGQRPDEAEDGGLLPVGRAALGRLVLVAAASTAGAQHHEGDEEGDPQAGNTVTTPEHRGSASVGDRSQKLIPRWSRGSA